MKPEDRSEFVPSWQKNESGVTMCLSKAYSGKKQQQLPVAVEWEAQLVQTPNDLNGRLDYDCEALMTIEERLPSSRKGMTAGSQDTGQKGRARRDAGPEPFHQLKLSNNLVHIGSVTQNAKSIQTGPRTANKLKRKIEVGRMGVDC